MEKVKETLFNLTLECSDRFNEAKSHEALTTYEAKYCALKQVINESGLEKEWKEFLDKVLEQRKEVKKKL